MIDPGDELRQFMARQGQKPERLSDCLAVADELGFVPQLRWLDALVRGRSNVYASTLDPAVARAIIPHALEELDAAIANLARARIALTWAKEAAEL